MKKIYLLLPLLIICVSNLFAQAPEKFTYQAVVRNASNQLVINTQVGVRVNILQGSASGDAVYSESHVTSSNANGLVTVNIGGGSVLHGSFEGIDWSDGPYFLKTDIDPNGGNDYSITSTQQLLSVPYALYAKEAGNSFSGDYNDLTNTPQIPTVPTNVSAFTNDAGYITGYTETDPQFTAWDKDYNDLINKPAIPAVPTNVSAFTNDAGYITAAQVPAQVNADWNATSGAAQILNKPALFSGNYNDLTNKPVLFSGNYNDLTNKPTLFDGNYNSLTNRPNLAAVATSGNYNDLINKPAIPTAVGELTNNVGYITQAQVPAQVNADWNATTGAAQILNKPTLFSGNYNDLTNKPVLFSGDYNDLTNLPQIPQIPADVSAFNNDAGYITAQDIPAIPTVPTNVSAFTNDAGYLTSYTEQQVLSISNDTLFLTGGSFVKLPAGFDGDYNSLTNKPVLFSGNYNDLTNLPQIPQIPADVSAFNNDAGYLTNYTETDPQFNAWDKDYNDLTNKPVIPAAANNATLTIQRNGSSVGTFTADASSNKTINIAVPTSTSELTNNSGFITAGDFPAVPENVSAFTNDAGYITNSGSNCDNTVNLCELMDRLAQLENMLNVLTVRTAGVTAVTENTFTVEGEVVNDGGATVTQRGFVYATTHNPTISNNRRNVGSGTGIFSATITSLTAGITYYVRAFATNVNGTVYGSEVAVTTTATTPTTDTPVDAQPCPGTPTVTDHEGNVYHTVQIGEQCWTKENLRTTTSPSTGTYLIPATSANSTYTGKQARWYNNDSTTYAPMNYGLLYNWNAAVDTFNTAYGETSVNSNSSNAVSVTFTGHRRGICPAGWHLPSDAEWTQLTNYVSSQSEYTCDSNSNYIAKALASTEGWNTSTNNCTVGNDPSTNNATGFSAVPAGNCGGSSFNYAGFLAYFWSSTQDNYACNRGLAYYGASVGRYYHPNYGFSVRCLRDSGGGDGSSATLPTVTTNTISNITPTTATCGGNIIADGGASVTARGVCWSTSQNPTISNSHTTNGSGTGSYSSSISGLTANTTYYVRAYATNSVGTAYGEEVTFTTLSAGGTAVIDSKSCPEAQTVTDHEGNVYATVQVGDQCWMRDNLRTTTSPTTGTYLIPVAGTGYTYTGKQAFWYNNDSATYAPMNYGLLYNWNAAADTFNAAYGEISVNTDNSNAVSVSFTGHRRGICPVGWHLPSDAEWTQLTDYVSSQSEYTCGGNSSFIAKALASAEGWNTHTNNCAVGNDPSLNNATGFSAVPAGLCSGSSFDYAGLNAAFWSSTQSLSDYAWGRSLDYYYAHVYRYDDYKYGGFSVRCLRDSGGGDGSSATLPTVTTNTVSNITLTTATSGGNIIADGGASVTARGVCWSTSQNPTVSNSYTTDGSGTGSFSSSISGLTANTTYYVRAYATNSVGTAYGNEVSFTTLSTAVIDAKSCPGTSTVTDHEGNVYATVQIGDQCWMRDNLRTTTSPSTGTYLIPAAGTDYTCTGKQAFWYNNDSATYAPMNYGLLYNWNAAVDTFNTAYGETSVNTAYNNAVFVTFSGHRRGICPAGWHLPSDAELTALIDYVSSQSGYIFGGNSSFIAKALASTEGWNTIDSTCAVGNDPSANNATGFSAVPAGTCDGSSFEAAGLSAYFWSSTEDGMIHAWIRGLDYNYADVVRYESLKDYGYSVRCLRD